MIYYDEYSSMIEVKTHNTDLKKRLSAFAAKCPQCCRQIDDDEQGGLLDGFIPDSFSSQYQDTGSC